MKRTNEYGIPLSIVAAVAADPYDRGDADYSVTELIKPPQIVRLWRAHEDEVVVDVRDEVWRLLGQGVHAVLERAGAGNKEQRLFYRFGGTNVSGQIDVIQDNKITDYKVTSVYSFAQGLKPEWEQQLNLYAWLCSMNDITITGLEIVAILRDWMKSRSDKSEYPQSPVKVIPVPLWLPEKQEEYALERIALHTGEATPNCSPEERWARGSWLHAKSDGKTRSYDTMAEAAAAANKGGGTIKSQTPTYVRCEQNWCGVADFCHQFQETKR